METAELFKTLADPTRLRIIHLIANREPSICVCDIMSVLQLPQSTVSRQLAVLRRTRLVHGRREGTWMHYSISKPQTPVQRAMIACLRKFLADEPELAHDLARYDKLNRNKSLSCCADDCCVETAKASAR